MEFCRGWNFWETEAVLQRGCWGRSCLVLALPHSPFNNPALKTRDLKQSLKGFGVKILPCHGGICRKDS